MSFRLSLALYALGDAVTGFLPSYGPPGAPWNLVVDNNCTICRFQPDASQTVDLSWHDVTVADGATYTVSIQFTGTAMYFFGIVPNTVTGDPIVQAVNVTFSLDGASTGSYIHIPDSTTTILYHVPMLAVDNLSNNAHTLVAYAQSSSWFFFDYAIYTFDDGTTVTSVGTPVVSQPPTSSKSDDTSTGSSASASSIRSSSVSQGVIPNSTVKMITTNTVQATTTTTAPANGTTGQDNSNQTTGPSPASSKSHSSIAIVVGSVCGALAILLACTLIWCRRRRSHRNVPRPQADAFVVDPTPPCHRGVMLDSRGAGGPTPAKLNAVARESGRDFFYCFATIYAAEATSNSAGLDHITTPC
ncbi:hypothetical protein MSAN_00533100 [Mycena sanguinolenta]|uniref:Uncharacterized protein n=1 Tax=Mycena sanguinolenta TaxID=230812 RepID=A0A8H7DHD4_9AGAR|nr:hypothetical protein MSAN_00533100 [Mycena sanguinolenta]